jgi:hypothetical protein
MIVANAANSPSGGNCVGGTTTDGGHNLDSGTSCGCGTANNSLSDTDPTLGALADNGGPTKPKVSAAMPTGTGIGRDTNVAATFSEKMGLASITNSTFKLFGCTSSTGSTTQVTNVSSARARTG